MQMFMRLWKVDTTACAEGICMALAKLFVSEQSLPATVLSD